MKNLPKILTITDSESTVKILSELLINKYEVSSYSNFDVSSLKKEKTSFEFILVDYLLLNEFKNKKQAPGFYKEKLEILHHIFPTIRVILLVDQRKIEEASPLLEIGFHNIIQLPLVKEIVEHRLFVEKERFKLQEVIKSNTQVLSPNKLFQSNNAEFNEALNKLEKVAKSKSTILITGESGTGKSLLAKHIHQLSGREAKTFIEVHCGAIPETLVESELFGHEKGAFTGAIKRKMGKFELADKGSLFLDEIGTISKSVQVKLLQVLQERFIQRVGGEADIPLDIRIIAATNTDLKQSVKQGSFREDLFYRLNVFHIEIPPLKERREDIPLIVEGILKKLNLMYRNESKSVSAEVMDLFHHYHWPGNVRELENILERAYILEESKKITVENIPQELWLKPVIHTNNLKDLSLIEARKLATDAFEKKYLLELLTKHHGKVSSMVQEAQVSMRQLHKLMAKHNIRAKDFS